MAKTKLRHRRSFLKVTALSLISQPAVAVKAVEPIPFSFVFESPSTEISLSIFEWPNMLYERGLFEYIRIVFRGPDSPPEAAYLGDEIKELPEWFDLGWRSPLLVRDPADQSRTFADSIINAKFYRQRIYIKSAIPLSVIHEVRRVKKTMLYLRFTFLDSKVKFDYYTKKEQ